jgi:putative membrane protein
MFHKFLGASALAAGLVLGVSAAQAQQPAAQPPAAQPQAQQSSGQQTPVQQAQKHDDAAKDFIKKAIQHNHAEVDAGKLAQEKAKNPAVKQFGAMMAKDHAEANEKAGAVAKVLDVDPPDSADMMHQASYLKLKLLQGDTFDRSYINDMVQDHENDVKEFEKAAAGGDQAATYAKEMLPKLKAHLEEAKKIDAQLNQATVGSGTNQSK